jgi:hypothetical protein
VKLTAEDRDVVIGRDGGLCVACGSRFEEIHHRYRRGMGGSSDPEINSPANLLCLCSIHHRQAESQRATYSAVLGYCVPTLAAAFLTPVRSWQWWELLLAGGTVLPLARPDRWSSVDDARGFCYANGLLPVDFSLTTMSRHVI